MGGWVAKYKKKHAEDQDPEAAAESAEIARLRAENEFLKKAAAFSTEERR